VAFVPKVLANPLRIGHREVCLDPTLGFPRSPGAVNGGATDLQGLGDLRSPLAHLGYKTWNRLRPSTPALDPNRQPKGRPANMLVRSASVEFGARRAKQGSWLQPLPRGWGQRPSADTAPCALMAPGRPRDGIPRLAGQAIARPSLRASCACVRNVLNRLPQPFTQTGSTPVTSRDFHSVTAIES
jgi:hypothetical protein